MGTLMDDEIKRWTARRKSALVLEIIQGKTTMAEASRAHDLPPSEIESWVEDASGYGVSLVLLSAPDDVLPSNGEGTEPSAALRSANQTLDRRTSGLWLSDRGAPVELQQEHGSTCFPADAVACEEAASGLCVFRLMPGHSSGASRAGIPGHAGPPFRWMPGR